MVERPASQLWFPGMRLAAAATMASLAMPVAPGEALSTPRYDPLPRFDAAGLPDLPARVRLLALHRPYAELVVDGTKTLETRGRAWPYLPGWLAICSTKKIDRVAMKRLGFPSERLGPEQAIVVLIWIAGSRPLLPEDEKAACFYAPNRFAWVITHRLRFARPPLVQEAGLTKPPQNFASVPRDLVLRALAAA